MNTCPQRQHGFTLVELMVALTLGLVITGIVLSIYLNTSRSHAQNERYAWMQENARYALKALTDDMTMVDFWGKVIGTDVIGTTVAPPPGDCGDDIDVFDADAALMVNNYHAAPAIEHFIPCADIAANLVPQTDVLVLKRVAGAWTSSTFVDVMDVDADTDTTETLTIGAGDLENGEVYLRSNGTTGVLISDAAPGNPPALGESDWRYTPAMSETACRRSVACSSSDSGSPTPSASRKASRTFTSSSASISMRTESPISTPPSRPRCRWKMPCPRGCTC